jgi:hypothetical protein
MSFFVTERLNAVMLAHGSYKGGRAAPQVMTSHLHLALSALDGRPPGSSGKSQFKAPA